MTNLLQLWMLKSQDNFVDIREIRTKNINFWADKLTRKVLAQRCGYTDTVYINQLCGGHGSFGNKTARKIERALNLPRGYFDAYHGEREQLEHELADQFSTLNEQQKLAVMDLVASMVRRNTQ